MYIVHHGMERAWFVSTSKGRVSHKGSCYVTDYAMSLIAITCIKARAEIGGLTFHPGSCTVETRRRVVKKGQLPTDLAHGAMHVLRAVGKTACHADYLLKSFGRSMHAHCSCYLAMVGLLSYFD